MMVIVNDDGRFLIAANSQVARWSVEYPDARTFRTARDAREYIARLPATMKLVGAKIVENYGLTTERNINA